MAGFDHIDVTLPARVFHEICIQTQIQFWSRIIKKVLSLTAFYGSGLQMSSSSSKNRMLLYANV